MGSSGMACRLQCLDDADDGWLSAILAEPHADVEASHVRLDECGLQDRLAWEEWEKRGDASSVACEPPAAAERTRKAAAEKPIAAERTMEAAARTAAACHRAQDAAAVCRAPDSIGGRAPGRAGDARPGLAREPGNEGTGGQATRAEGLHPELRSPLINHGERGSLGNLPEELCSRHLFHSTVMPRVLMSATDKQGAARPSEPGPETVSRDPSGGSVHDVTRLDAQAGHTCGALSVRPQECAIVQSTSSPRASRESAVVHSLGGGLRGVAKSSSPQPSGLCEGDEVLLPRDVIGETPEGHFVNFLDVLFGRGITLGLDKLISAPAASTQQRPNAAGTSGSASTGRTETPEAVQSLWSGANGGAQAQVSSLPSDPASDSMRALAAGLPPAVAMKVFGPAEALELRAPMLSSKESPQCSGYESQALHSTDSLNDRLAAALSRIQERKVSRQPEASLVPLAPERARRKRAQDVPGAMSFFADCASEALASGHRALARVQHGQQRQKRVHIEIQSGPLGRDGVLRGPLASLAAEPSFAGGSSCSGLLAVRSQAAGASAALVLPRHVPPPSSKVAERERILMQLTDMVLSLERKDMHRFGALYVRLRDKAKRHGRAIERAVFHALQSLILLRDGTGFDFICKPSRKNLQELDNARKWYFTAHPSLVCGYMSSAGLALPKLKGRTSIHIVLVGTAVMWPIFFKFLAQDPTHGPRLKRVRLTIIDTWRMLYPNRRELLNARGLDLLVMSIRAAAAQMGLECTTRIVIVEDDSLDWLDVIDRSPGDEALALCSLYELSYLHDEPQYNGGLRLRLFQALKYLRADVVTVGVVDIPDGSNPSLVQRFQSCFRYLWTQLDSHDSLGIHLHQHVGFAESLMVHDFVTAVSLTGVQRRYRPLSASEWQESLLAWGFTPLKVDPSAVEVMKGILKAYPDFFHLESTGPWLKFVYEGAPLISVSAWAS